MISSGCTTFITTCKRSLRVWGKGMFLHMSVILSTGGGVCIGGRVCIQRRGICIQGVCIQWGGGSASKGRSASRGVDSVHRGEGISLTEIPLGQRPAWTDTPSGKERAVRILLECILVNYYYESDSDSDTATDSFPTLLLE